MAKTIKGRVFLSNGLPAANIEISLNNVEFGSSKFIQKAKTDSNGYYSINMPDGAPVLYFISTKDKDSKDLTLMNTKFSTEKEDVINLVAPVDISTVDHEFKRLSAALQPLLNGKKLSSAREDDANQEISLLCKRTGWDSKLISLAATAEKISATVELDPQVLYGLFRAGLPTDAQQLSRINENGIRKALEKVKNAGIINVDVNSSVQKFKTFANKQLLQRKVLGGTTNLRTFLPKTLDEAGKNKLVELLSKADIDDDQFWQSVQTITPNHYQNMKIQGKLSFLTFNNNELNDKLLVELGASPDLSALAEKGFYNPDKWKKYISDLGGNKEEKIKALIPENFLGNTTDERLIAYSNDMARKVKESYPTLTLSKKIENAELKIDNPEVLKILKAASKLKINEKDDYIPGNTSFHIFLKKNKDSLLQGIAAKDISPAIESAKRLTRLYQLSPTDESFKVLYELGFNSALDITAYPKEYWMKHFGSKFTKVEAEVIYRKAEQIRTVVYNFYTAAAQINTSLSLHTTTGTQVANSNTRNGLKDKFPSLESLFGSLDYCECKQSRSVLSPAAYLVDILKFLDPDDEAWSRTLKIWKETHGSDYQYKRPFEELINRRPDIPLIKLSSENTSIEMPYIDIANEILECSVANKSLNEVAFDNFGFTSSELMAEPQNIIPSAYEILSTAKYPLNLPFDYSLELTRKICNYFKVPLWELLQKLIKTNKLFKNDETAYNDIFMEYLCLNPAEYNLFTNPDFTNWYTLYGYSDSAKALSNVIDEKTKEVIGLVSAKTISRKLSITYKELVLLVKSHFINPCLQDLTTLKTIGINVNDVYRWKAVPGYTPYNLEEKNWFESKLALATTMEFDAKKWLETSLINKSFDKVILLFEKGISSDFDNTSLLYANKESLTDLDWVKLNLFVRLWKKTGWKIEELDAALVNFIPKDEQLTKSNFGNIFKTVLIYISHLKFFNDNYPLGKLSLQKWSAFWGDITLGFNSVYSQYFLTQSIKADDPVFDHPMGKYLMYNKDGAFLKFSYNAGKAEDKAAGNIGFINHIKTVQTAFEISYADIALVLENKKIDILKAPLDMEILKLLHGYKILKDLSGFSIKDIISLENLSGIHPVMELSTKLLTEIENDIPFSQTLKFIELIEKIKEANISINELEYLIRHNFEVSGQFKVEDKSVNIMIRFLTSELMRIQSELASPKDKSVYTDEFMQSKLSMALSGDIAETFINLWKGTVDFTSERKLAPGNKLPSNLFKENGKASLKYNDLLQIQSVSYRGFLCSIELEEMKKTLDNLETLPSGNEDKISSIQKKYATEMLTDLQNQYKSFFKEYIWQPFFSAEQQDYNYEKFIPISENDKESKREVLTNCILQYLKNKMTEEVITNYLSDFFKLNRSLVGSLLINTEVKSVNNKSLLENFKQLNRKGVNICFYKKDENAQDLINRPIISGEAKIESKAIPASAQLIIIKGFFECTKTGIYRFSIKGENSICSIKFSFDHLTEALINKNIDQTNAEISEIINLEAGSIYRISMEIRNFDVQNTNLSLNVQSENLSKINLSQLKPIPVEIIDNAINAFILTDKISQIITRFNLQKTDLEYFTKNSSSDYRFEFAKLPLLKLDLEKDQQAIELLFRQFMLLSDYSKLKKQYAGNETDFLILLEYANNNNLEKIIELIALKTSCDAAILRDVVNYFKFDSGSFQKQSVLETVWNAITLIFKIGIPINSIEEATKCVSKQLAFPDRLKSANSFRLAFKSGYSSVNWLNVAQNIYDDLRKQKRDALSSYLMAQFNFHQQGQLFERFLIDPGMEPVVKTTRIRLAIASVQSFVQRSLLNLEENVKPYVISRKLWDWMKKYRVWEANRKIFLCPENYLLPNFRDDKTYLFQELESGITQGDVSQELIEKLFYDYLKGLEKIARLNLVAMYCEEDPVNSSGNTIHLIGKNFSEPAYFYRTYRNKMWTPWVPIPNMIEGEHLSIIKWQDRIHVFWLTFVPGAESVQTESKGEFSIEASAKKNASDLITKKVDIILNWCEYFQGKWHSRQTGGSENAMVAPVNDNIDMSGLFIHTSIEYDSNGNEKAVVIHISAKSISKSFRLVSKLATLEVTGNHKNAAEPPFLNNINRKTKHYIEVKDNKLTLNYNSTITHIEEVTDEEKKSSDSEVPTTVDLFKNVKGISLLCNNDPITISGNSEIDKLSSPFFLEDNENSVTMYVEPELTEKTIVTWEKWIIKEKVTTITYEDDFFEKVPLQPAIPYDKLIDFRKSIDVINDPHIRFKDKIIDPEKDWVTNPGTIMRFDKNFINTNGSVLVEKVNNDFPGGINIGNIRHVSFGNVDNFVSGQSVVLKEHPGVSSGSDPGLEIFGKKTEGINLVGSGGLRTPAFKNINPSGLFRAIH